MLSALTVGNATANTVFGTGTIVTSGTGGNISGANVISGNTVIVTTGANVNGYLTVSGVTTLGAVANVKITGGTSGYVLRTDGAANLTWVAQGGGGGGVTLGAVVAQSLGMALP